MHSTRPRAFTLPLRHRLLVLGTVGALGITTGCSVPFPRCQRSVDPQLQAYLTGRFVEQPKCYKLTARAILRTAGMDLPLTLRVLRRWPDKLRVVAMDDLGNTLFHFLRVQGTTTLVHCAKPIPLALVTEGTAGDLELWLLDGPHPADYPVRHDAGAGLLRHLGDYSTLHWMSAAGASIDRIAHGRGGGLESLLALEWREQRPHSARIVNHRLSYELDVDVREWSAEELGLEQFDPPAGQPR